MRTMNKQKVIYTIISLIFSIFVIIVLSQNVYKTNTSSYRALTRPLAKEPLLISSAGQNTDIYIVKDIINKLMIDNYFIPMATTENLDDIHSAIMVVGYSEVGNRLKDKTYIEEKQRVEQFVNAIEEKDVFLITIYLRGGKMLSEETKTLLDLSAKSSDYVIIVNPENEVDTFKEMVSSTTPITFVDDLSEVTEPIVSAFR